MLALRSASIALLLAVLSASASALDVLGFELSVTTRQAFLDRLKENPALSEIPATDRYIVHGYIVQIDQTQFPSLKRVAFMFDPSDRLCMVFLEVPIEYFDVEVQRASLLYQFIDATGEPNGIKEAYFGEGTNRISIATRPQWTSTVVMMMNAGYRKDAAARMREHGLQPKYE